MRNSLLLLLCLTALPCPAWSEGPIALPAPRTSGTVSLEQALAQRRSQRQYRPVPLTLAEVSQLLWAAQGSTGPRGDRRTCPSAGALYPLEVYLLVGQVRGLAPGSYRYRSQGHRLERLGNVDLRPQVQKAVAGSTPVASGAVVLVLSGVHSRTAVKYGDRATRYIALEAGHAAQNVYLQATALGLGTVSVGAFQDAALKKLLPMAADETPLYLMPVGRL